jgi:hypothetical protein
MNIYSAEKQADSFHPFPPLLSPGYPISPSISKQKSNNKSHPMSAFRPSEAFM